jgi:hypothetical protein
LLWIIGGGTVTATTVSVNSTSLLAIDVARGSSLKVGSGTGTVTNNGTVRIVAGAGVMANTTYLPISTGSWSGTGIYQAVGGSMTGHAFTASSVASATSGSPVALDLKSIQRALINDSATGWEVGASFVAATASQNITFTATPMSGATLDALKSILPVGETFLSGWNFSTSNYTVSSTNPVYLSFNVGSGNPADWLDVWHYDGSAWTKFTPLDLTYDGKYASFTANSFSGYAMAVPEPSALALLAAALLALVARTRQTPSTPR